MKWRAHMIGNHTLKVVLTVATCNSPSKEVFNTLWCDVLSKFMTNFLQPELCVETELLSMCPGILMDINSEFWGATFRMQRWKVPTLNNLNYSTFVLYPNICRAFFSFLTIVSLLCSLSFYLLFILLCLLFCLFSSVTKFRLAALAPVRRVSGCFCYAHV